LHDDAQKKPRWGSKTQLLSGCSPGFTVWHADGAVHDGKCELLRILLRNCPKSPDRL
jgi:hypothetical protein